MFKRIFFIFIVTCGVVWHTSVALAAPVTGHYVRIELLGEDRILSLAEVEILNPQGSNVALGKPAKQTQPQNTSWPASNGVNGSTTDFTHTSKLVAEQRYHWWEVDLGTGQDISTIKVTNRGDCCPERLNPARVLILDGNRNLLWLGTIDTTAATYNFTVQNPATPPQPLNLLLNAHFTQKSNPDRPDHWGVYTSFLREIPDAENMYRVNENITPPSEAPNAKVVEFVNPNNFPYLYFMATRMVELRPAGQYTFSFYLKADGTKTFDIHKGLSNFNEVDANRTATTQWQRYSVTFNWSGNFLNDELAPIIRLPVSGIYHIAAPQLEEGPSFSAFHLAIEDTLTPLPKYIEVDPDILTAVNDSPVPQPDVKAVFEYDYYTTNEAEARLRITSTYQLNVDVICTSPDAPGFFWSTNDVLIDTVETINMDISGFSENQQYTCAVNPVNFSGPLAMAGFIRLPTNATESRMNRFTGALMLKSTNQTQPQPFYIQGMAVTHNYNAGLLYFQQLVDRSINTVVYTNAKNNTIDPNDPSQSNTQDIDSVLTNAKNKGLKVIVGQGFAGKKDANTASQMQNYYRLVEQYKDDPAVIGWYAVDEPDSSWSTQDLLDVHNTIKQIDPYRFVFINWNGNSVNYYQVGQEPMGQSGVLNTTDLYSRTGYYPFAFRKNMSVHTEVAFKAQRTAKLFNKASHGWLQLWGYGSAWREPTLAEFRYMAYLNAMYGSMYSYWDTKSSSSFIWNNIKQIHDETSWLALNLMYNETTQEILSPQIDPNQKNFIYSALLNQSNECYVIVVHNDNPAEEFSIDPDTCFQNSTSITSKFENDRQVLLDSSGLIRETFQPYQTRVYVITNCPDTDSDGLNDCFEQQIGTNPILADSDNDGLTDYFEVNYDGNATSYDPYNPTIMMGGDLNAISPDTDGDGVIDSEELNAGSNPLDQNSVPAANGDINGDGLLNIGDLVLALRHVLGLTTLNAAQINRGDLYPAAAGDGLFNLSDLLLLQQQILSEP
jgi:hypothetical protein